jgi:hypothetical protein
MLPEPVAAIYKAVAELEAAYRDVAHVVLQAIPNKEYDAAVREIMKVF